MLNKLHPQLVVVSSANNKSSWVKLIVLLFSNKNNKAIKTMLEEFIFLPPFLQNNVFFALTFNFYKGITVYNKCTIINMLKGFLL